jgi:hypothetical protein
MPAVDAGSQLCELERSTDESKHCSGEFDIAKTSAVKSEYTPVTATKIMCGSRLEPRLRVWQAQQRLLAVLEVLTSMFKTSAQLRLENLAIRQQLTVLRRSAPKRLKLTRADRIALIKVQQSA